MTFSNRTHRNFLRGLALCGLLAFPHLSSASPSMIEMHEHVSEMHKNAANCLKSGKTEAQCHKAMMSECKDHSKKMTGEMNCPMMGQMEKMDGMHEHSDESDKQ